MNNQLFANQNVLSRFNVSVEEEESFAGKTVYNNNDPIPIREMITDFNTLEPTPINPNGVTSVSAVSLESASLNADRAFLASLRTILGKDDSSGFFTTNVPIPVKSQFIQALTGGNLLHQQQSAVVAQQSPSDGQQNNFDNSFATVSSTSALDVSLDGSSEEDESSSVSGPLRPSQQELWSLRFQELLEFKKKFHHCLVPLHWPSNPSLAHWVKRQRNQYRAKQLGRHSTLTPDREQALEDLGFVWDSHAAIWEERWKELRDFERNYGHCRVPKKYPQNQQLAFWVKCQRRQFKLYCAGRDSNMTPDRIEKLLSIGFDFAPRLCPGNT